MKLHWIFEKEDKGRILSLIEAQGAKTFVKKRIERNVSKSNTFRFRKAQFWEIMLMCLLSTQQRAGPGSRLNTFFNKRPFSLSLDVCALHERKLDLFVEKTLTSFGGIRRAPTIGREAAYNLHWLNQEGWNELVLIAHELIALKKKEACKQCMPVERRAARLISDNLKGFGPKQSRNLWQTLGLFRFEIPIDSRITKWLNRNGFPLELSASALSDHNYYDFVMTGIQDLCRKCGVLPCVLDAAIFASFDQDLPKNDLVW